ncbi:MAG: LexA family transcriptional regulator [Bacteroidetes bacterium]|nr:MAG: LexA family transcriptional regulator [Bacteroidota bacterium]TAE66427.1 MAG: LexA family transcriptional regulator [Bacteroidota bacterium]TAF98281.1 MAG: LexA family transcriptional regulator [Bacteroidota bacterium]
MSVAGKNFKYLRKLRGWTQEEFANRLGIKRSLIGAYEEERAEPRLEVLEQVCFLFKLSLDDLLLNDLTNEKTKGSYLDKRRQLKMMNDVQLISFVPVKAAAGYLNGYADPEFVDELNTFTLPMLAPGQYRAFEIVGDSMLPTVSGSVIVGEKVESLEDVKNNFAYIVVSKQDGIVYKRIVKNNKTKQKVTLVSDNPVFEPYSINTEDILELWRAQMVISKAVAAPQWDMNQLGNLVTNLQDQIASLKKKVS